jgi:hypothetical protein
LAAFWAAYGPIIVLVLSGLVLVLVGVLIWLGVRLLRVERWYRGLTADTTGGNLVSVLDDHIRRVREAAALVKVLDDRVFRLEQNARGHVQRVGFLRFNPFRDTGGDQSFALALADADGNGVILSSLHSRDVTRLYAKPLIAWESAYQMTDEERQVINRARGE